MVWKVSGLSGKFLDFLESFWVVWKVFVWSGKFLDCFEHFRIVRKVSVWSVKFLYCLGSFNNVWNLSGLFRKSFVLSGKYPIFLKMFLDCPESFCNVWKVVRLSGKFLDGLEPFPIVRKDFVLFWKFLCYLASFLTVWKVSGLSGKFWSVWNLSRLSRMFLYCLDSFPIIWTVYGLSWMFPDYPESCFIVWKVSLLSGKFPYCLESFLDCLEHFQIVRKVFFLLFSGKFPYCLESFHIGWNFFWIGWNICLDQRVCFWINCWYQHDKGHESFLKSCYNWNSCVWTFSQKISFKRSCEAFWSNHKDKGTMQTFDQIKTFNSIKVLHGVWIKGKFDFGKQGFLNIALKLLCKTPNQAVVESMGSMLQNHMKPERNANQTAFTADMHIDKNGPVVSRADHHLSASLNHWFGSRMRWHFKTGSKTFYTLEVVDRKKTEVSRLYFWIKHHKICFCCGLLFKNVFILFVMQVEGIFQLLI